MFQTLLAKAKKKPLADKIDEPLIFIHLEKTAGVTFQSYLRSLMPSENVIATPYYNRHKTVAEYFRDHSKRLYMGHASYRDCRALNLRGYYLTFLREPYARAFSYYSFQKSRDLSLSWARNLHPQEIAIINTVQQMTFQEYVLSENILIYRHIKDLMSRRLAMVSPKRGVLKLDTAFDVLVKDFYWFGLTEEFDKSIQLLNMSLFGRPDSKVGMIVERNISPKYDNILDEKGMQRLKELNEYDLKLYENARSLFYERYQKSGLGPSLAKPWTAQEIHFNPPHSKIAFYARGLSIVEYWGMWSEGSVVTLIFNTSLPAKFSLFLRAKAFGPNAGKNFTVEIGDSVVPFKLGHFVRQQRLELTNAIGAKTILIRVPAPTSPKELGKGDDTRKLGIGFVTLRIVPR